MLTEVEVDNNRGEEYNEEMLGSVHRQYKLIQKVLKYINDEANGPFNLTKITIKKTDVQVTDDELEKSLEYLKNEGLISYTATTSYSGKYDEYCRKLSELEAKLNQPKYSTEYFIGKTEWAKNVSVKRNMYEKQIKAEKLRSKSTVFTVELQPNFNKKYAEIMSRCGGDARYVLHLEGKYLYINNECVSTFKASWRLQLFQAALRCDNGAVFDAETYIPKSNINKKLRGLPQLLPETIDSQILRELFFRDVKATSFKIYHSITDAMVEESGYDTILIDKEIKSSAKNKQR